MGAILKRQVRHIWPAQNFSGFSISISSNLMSAVNALIFATPTGKRPLPRSNG